MSSQSNRASARADTERSVLVPTIETLQRHAPFDRMAASHLEFLAKHVRLAFYPKGEVITEPERGAARTLYIIKQGRVRGELARGRSPSGDEVWELEAGECFPIGAVLARRPVVMKHRAVEDTFCFELDREDFDRLLALSPVFQDFCSRRLATLLAETRRGMQADPATQNGALSFNALLAGLIRRAPVICAPELTLRQAVACMHAERVDSIVVTDARGDEIEVFNHPSFVEKWRNAVTTLDMTQREAHWHKTRNLMIIHLVIWFVFSYVVHWFAPQLNKISFLDFPLGFYMAAQGSLIVFVVQLFVFAKQQDKIDREFGVAEED